MITLILGMVILLGFIVGLSYLALLMATGNRSFYLTCVEYRAECIRRHKPDPIRAGLRKELTELSLPKVSSMVLMGFLVSGLVYGILVNFWPAIRFIPNKVRVVYDPNEALKSIKIPEAEFSGLQVPGVKAPGVPDVPGLQAGQSVLGQQQGAGQMGSQAQQMLKQVQPPAPLNYDPAAEAAKLKGQIPKDQPSK